MSGVRKIGLVLFLLYWQALLKSARFIHASIWVVQLCFVLLVTRFFSYWQFRHKLHGTSQEEHSLSWFSLSIFSILTRPRPSPSPKFKPQIQKGKKELASWLSLKSYGPPAHNNILQDKKIQNVRYVAEIKVVQWTLKLGGQILKIFSWIEHQIYFQSIL